MIWVKHGLNTVWYINQSNVFLTKCLVASICSIFPSINVQNKYYNNINIADKKCASPPYDS